MPNITPAIIAAAVLAFAVPATAAPAQGAKMQAKIIQKNGETLYCVKQTTTGSRLPQKTCLTKEQWQERGANIAAVGQDHKLASNPQVSNLH